MFGCMSCLQTDLLLCVTSLLSMKDKNGSVNSELMLCLLGPTGWPFESWTDSDFSSSLHEAQSGVPVHVWLYVLLTLFSFCAVVSLLTAVLTAVVSVKASHSSCCAY